MKALKLVGQEIGKQTGYYSPAEVKRIGINRWIVEADVLVDCEEGDDYPEWKTFKFTYLDKLNSKVSLFDALVAGIVDQL